MSALSIEILKGHQGELNEILEVLVFRGDGEFHVVELRESERTAGIHHGLQVESPNTLERAQVERVLAQKIFGAEAFHVPLRELRGVLLKQAYHVAQYAAGDPYCNYDVRYSRG